MCQDHTVVTALVTTATLPCRSTDKMFPSNVLLLYWYKGDDSVTSQSIVRFTLSTGDLFCSNGDSPDKYQYNIHTKALKFKNVQYSDELWTIGKLYSLFLHCQVDFTKLLHIISIYM